MAKRTKTKKSEDDAVKVGRLTDMDTREVSVVDHPANKRRFLIVKQDGEYTEEDMGSKAKKNDNSDSGAGTAVADAPAPEAPAVETETSKRVVGARVEEVLGRVQAIKSTVETAKASEGTEGNLPSAVGAEIRAAQFLLKGVAGLTKGVSLLIPAGDSLESVTEIESAVQKGTVKILDEVERRLETMKADLAEADMVDPSQGREIDGVADLLGKALTDYPTTKAQTLVIVKSSLSDEDREVLKGDLEKALGELGEIYMALSTDSITKGEVAGADEISDMIHKATTVLETSVAKMGNQDVVGINKAVEMVRALDGVGVDAEVTKALVGVLTPIAKASTMFRACYHGDGYATKLSTADEVVAKFDTWEEAEMDALKRNIETVTSVAKSAKFEGAETDTNKETDVDAGTETDTNKVGRAMQGDRLNRLISTAKLLKDALGEMQAGTLSMEKFKKAATVLSDVIRECQTKKAAQLARGMDADYTGNEDPNTPNHGSGAQPESDATTAAKGLAGEGTPDMSDVLKAEVAKARAEFQSEIDSLKSEVTTLRKSRAIPATTPVDGDEGVQVETQKASSEKVVWGADMNEEIWED